MKTNLRCYNLFALSLCLLVHAVAGYEIGAPETACTSMTPGHGYQIQTSKPPYSLTLSGSDNFTVTISSSINFKGFLLKAKSETGPDTEYVGRFKSPPARTRRACTYKAMTHTDSFDKVSDELTFTWVPPDDICGDFVFMATIVKEFSTIWKNVKSSRVRIKCPTTTTSTTTTTTSPTTAATISSTSETITSPESNTESTATSTSITTATSTPATTTSMSTSTTVKTTSEKQVISKGWVWKDNLCHADIGCLYDCVNDDCNYIITWKNLTESIEFSIMVKLPGTGNQWAALALSDNKMMGNDSVIACQVKNDAVSVEQYYNTDVSRQNIYVSNGKQWLTLLNGSISDSVLHCRFERLKHVPGIREMFNLTEKWYILFGTGPLMPSGFLAQHTKRPIVSDSKVDFLSTGEVKGDQAEYKMVKIHATLMMLAWLTCASIGIITARYYKQQWSNTIMGGEKVWFTIHRTCMVLTFLCTVAAVIIIFIEVGGYIQIPPDGFQYQHSHPILGLIVTALTVINPIMALFRPSPDSKNRPIFNNIHTCVGFTAFIIAIMTVVFGLALYKADLPKVAHYIIYAYCGVQGLIVCILEMVHRQSLLKASNTYEISTAGTRNKMESRVEGIEKGSQIKVVVFSIHSLLSIGFSAGLIYIIWSS